MEDTTKVLDLLEELEDLMEDSKAVPLSNKVMVEPEDIFAIIKDIRLALPDDMQQARWIREERDRILADAKAEYERIIKEATKQADYLVESDEITKRATALANEIIENAKVNGKIIRMKTYDYVDQILFNMQKQMDEINMKYLGEMFTKVDNTLNEIGVILNDNRNEIRDLALKTREDINEE